MKLIRTGWEPACWVFNATNGGLKAMGPKMDRRQKQKKNAIEKNIDDGTIKGFASCGTKTHIVANGF